MEKSTFIIRNRSFFHFNLLLNHLDHLCILHRNSMKKFNFLNFIFQPILLCSFQFTQLGITKKKIFPRFYFQFKNFWWNQAANIIQFSCSLLSFCFWKHSQQCYVNSVIEELNFNKEYIALIICKLSYLILK